MAGLFHRYRRDAIPTVALLPFIGKVNSCRTGFIHYRRLNIFPFGSVPEYRVTQ